MNLSSISNNLADFGKAGYTQPMAKTRTPLQDRSRETRDKLVQAGLRLFREKGYSAINTKDIAQEAGVAIGSFYVYFQDKTEVFREVMEIFLQEVSALGLEKFLQTPAGADPRAQLEQLIHVLIDLTARFGCVYRDLQSRFHDDDGIRDLLENLYARFFDLASRLLGQAGFTHIDPAVTQVIIILLENTLYHAIYLPGPVPRSHLVKEVANCLFQYLHRPQ